MPGKEKVQKSRPVAFCAMMAALSVVVMLLGGLVPVFTYCSPLIASILLLPALDEYGAGKAWMVWFVTAVLTLLTGVDKEAAFFYIFFGWYPILKPLYEKIPGRFLRFFAKMATFAAATAAMYGLICFVFRIGDIVSTFSSVFWINAAFFVCLVAVMLLYDRTLVGIWVIYRTRIRSRLGRKN